MTGCSRLNADSVYLQMKLGAFFLSRAHLVFRYAFSVATIFDEKNAARHYVAQIVENRATYTNIEHKNRIKKFLLNVRKT